MYEERASYDTTLLSFPPGHRCGFRKQHARHKVGTLLFLPSHCGSLVSQSPFLLNSGQILVLLGDCGGVQGVNSVAVGTEYLFCLRFVSAMVVAVLRSGVVRRPQLSFAKMV